MSELKKYFHKKRISIKRTYISNKLDRAIRISKAMLEQNYKKKYGKKSVLTYQATSEAVGDRIIELIQDGKW